MARRDTGRYLHPGLLGLGAAAFFVLVVAAAQAELSSSGAAGTISLSSPAQDGGITNAPAVTVAGTLSDPGALLAINGQAVAVGSGGTFSRAVALAEGLNVLRITATTPAGDRTQLVVTVTRDDVPPSLTVFAPSAGAVLADDRATVFGQAELGSTVSVNGRTADVSAFDGSFSVSDLTLAPTASGCLQPATVTVAASDRAGNVATVVRSVQANHCVTHPTLAAPIPTLTVGAGQTEPLAIDLSSYFADDGGADLLIFSTYVNGPAASTLSVTYSARALSLDWLGAPSPGTSSVSITARDRNGEVSDPVAVPLIILSAPIANRAPVITLPSAVDALPVGGALLLPVAVVDGDGDATSLSAEGVGEGVRVLSVDRVDPTHFTVRVTADPAALSGGSARVVFTASDARFAASQAALTLTVYDASLDVGLAVASPANPEVLSSDLVQGPGGAPGLFVELSAVRRVPHLYLSDPRSAPGAAEVPALNGEQTYWRLFVPVPAAAGVHVLTVFAVDPGLAPQALLFAVTVLPTPSAPALDRIVPVEGTLVVDEGQPISLTWSGAVPNPADTVFEWRVDGEVVSRASQLTGVVLDAGSHAVSVSATSSQGSSSASSTVKVNARAGPVLPARSTPWLLLFGLSGLVVVGLILGGTEIGIYFLFTALLGAIIDRENREKLLAHFVRGRIYQIIEYEPGVHLSELQRKAGVARGVCAYHLHALEKAGLVKTARDGMFLRFFATKVRIDADAYALASDDCEVLRAIEARPGITEREVAELLGKNAIAVSRSVKTLAQSGYLEARKEGDAVQLFARTGRGSAPAPTGNP